MQFNARLSSEEEARLEAITKHYGISRTDVFRMLLKREADALAATKGR